jgi:hypothetical protein
MTELMYCSAAGGGGGPLRVFQNTIQKAAKGPEISSCKDDSGAHDGLIVDRPVFKHGGSVWPQVSERQCDEAASPVHKKLSITKRLWDTIGVNYGRLLSLWPWLLRH